MPGIDAINALDAGAFSRLLGPVYEHSPWIAERAFARRPFATPRDLHLALYGVVLAATEAEQLALLNAHPELAGKEAEAGALTAASRQEQGSAGLDRLTREELATLANGNARYRERFGFPFIIAVRLHSRASIFAALEGRFHNTRAQELQNAIAQVGEIARLRLAALIPS
ncbi:MAG: 2-oxo-4-hydroxy-4-carboxy-5-ureidoimidazoline decarboxylase [Betaproteobacteria bacterium]|nr:2-oxo-4-hydroxy-4-carboxy-5-ureidoimidazoline decarboxylase [Betaproteobacteria bacterium]